MTIRKSIVVKSELPIPPIAIKDDRAIELLRVWAASGNQHVSIAANVWDDPANWGLMLVDLARHVANAIADEKDANVNDVLSRIREGFDTEWAVPTD